MVRVLGRFLAGMLLAGCAAWPNAAGIAGTAGTAGKVSAVAAVYPLAWIAAEIAPEAEVTLLSEGRSDAHDIDISPAQRAAVETAGVVLYMGDIDYQPQLEQAVADATGEVVDVVEVAGDDRVLRAGEHDHPDEADNADEAAAVDPHLWFDPSVMADVAARTGRAFAAADPANADDYAANAERLAGEFADLDDQVDELLAGPCDFDEVVISHVAYAYLTQPRGKRLHGITGTGSEAGASGGVLAELVAEVRNEGYRYVLAEPVEGRADAEAVAGEAGVELLDIYPLDVLTPEQSGADFPDLLLQQVSTLAAGYGCR